MKHLLLLLAILFFTVCSAHSQTKNPFISLKYDRVVVYDYNREDMERSIVEGGKLTTSIQKQAQLGPNEISGLNTKVWEKRSYGGGVAACFIPHLGIVYYRQNKIVAHISICMDCNRLVSSIDIPAQRQGKQGSGKDVYYLGDGMSKSFRTFLNGLIKKYKFSHAISQSSFSGM